MCSKVLLHCSGAPFTRTEKGLIHVVIFRNRKPARSSSSCLPVDRKQGGPAPKPNPFSHAPFGELARGQQCPLQEGQRPKVTDGRVSAALHLPPQFSCLSFCVLASFSSHLHLRVQSVHPAAADSAALRSPVTGADRNVITPQRWHTPLRWLRRHKLTFRQLR